MSLVRLLPVLLSALLIGAHFFRHRNWLLLAAVVAVTALLLVKNRWAARLVQLGLLLAALEWLRSLFTLVRSRQAMGMEWHRLAAILGAVALATLLSGLVFRLPALRQRYRLEPGREGE